jgi:hypothetical protein
MNTDATTSTITLPPLSEAIARQLTAQCADV